MPRRLHGIPHRSIPDQMRCAEPKRLPLEAAKRFHRPDGRLQTHIKVGCGRCTACEWSIKQDWIFRLEQEQLHREAGASHFLTFTYADPYVTKEKLTYAHIQSWAKRCTKAGAKFKYFCVGEYGTTTYRPHWHLVTFGIESGLAEHIWRTGHQAKSVKYSGITDARPLCYNRISYITNYLDKNMYPIILAEDPLFTGVQQMRKMSKGIGKAYLEQVTEHQLEHYYNTGEFKVKTNSGVEIQLPRYYFTTTGGIDEMLGEETDCITDIKMHNMAENEAILDYNLKVNGRTHTQYLSHLKSHDKWLRQRLHRRLRQ